MTTDRINFSPVIILLLLTIYTMLRKISVLLNDRVTISRIPLLQSNCQALLTLSSTRCLHCHSLGCHLNDDPSAVIWDSLSILTESFLTFRKIVATSTMLQCTVKHRISFARGRERDEETRSCDGESTRRPAKFYFTLRDLDYFQRKKHVLCTWFTADQKHATRQLRSNCTWSISNHPSHNAARVNRSIRYPASMTNSVARWINQRRMLIDNDHRCTYLCYVIESFAYYFALRGITN